MPRTFKDEAAKHDWETGVLTDFTSQENSVIQSGQYCQTLCQALIKAADANMSKTSYRLLLYLSGLYPFSDRYIDLPSQSELALRLGVTRQSINTAQAEIQAAGLWDFRVEKWKGRNLSTRQMSKTVSKKVDTCQKNLTPYQKDFTPSQKDLTPQPLEPSHSNGSSTPQISSDLLKKRERESENNFFGEKALEPEQGGTLTTERESQAAHANDDLTQRSTNYTQGGICSGQGAAGNFKTYVSFESTTCNWVDYDCPGYGGSDPNYFVYRRAKTLLLAQERQRQKDEGKRRVKLIDEFDSYTCACIATGGARDYDKWVSDGRPLEPPLVVPKAAAAKPSEAVQSESPLTNQAKSLVLDQPPDFSPPPVSTADIERVLGNRRRLLQKLFEEGKFDEMQEKLTTWLAAKDCPVDALLKDQPWSLTVTGGRIALEVKA